MRILRQCKYCGNNFTYNSNERHLGNYCSFEHYNAHRKAKPKTCVYCNAKFVSYDKRRKFCNHSCAMNNRIATESDPLKGLKKAWKVNKENKQSYKGMPKPAWLTTPEAEKKKALAKTGKPLLKMRGANHPNWKGGITEKNHKIRTSLEYKEWRKAVFERDNYTCVWCVERGGKLNADHVKPFALYPELRLDINNGRTLCVPCHRKTDTFGRPNQGAIISVDPIKEMPILK